MSKSAPNPKMTALLKCMLVINAISEVTSYNIISRRLQNPQPALYRYKVYSPEVRAVIRQRAPQRALRLTPLLLAQNAFHAPAFRQKSRYRVSSNVRPAAKPSSVVYRPRRFPPGPNEETPLKSVVSNEIDESGEFYQTPDLEYVPAGDGEHFPSFGKGNINGANIHGKPGIWASPGLETENSDESFTPIQTYYQIRQTNRVKHLPQSEALKEAETLEEVLNAPRLKELLRTTRLREMYSEEGYEDTGYDHGGHVRHAEHNETYKTQDEGMFKIQENAKEEDYTMPELKENAGVARVIPVEEESQESKLNPKIVKSRSEISRASIAYSTLPPKYKGEHKYSSKIRARKPGEPGESKSFNIVTTEMYPTGFWALPTVFESLIAPLSSRNMNLVMFDSSENVAKTKAFDTMDDAVGKASLQSKYVATVKSSDEPARDLVNHKSINSSSLAEGGIKKNKQKQKSKEFKYNRLHLKFPKYDRFRWGKSNHLTITTEKPERKAVQLDTNFDDGQVILSSIGYINSLTTAHFGNKNSVQASNDNVLTTAMNLTEALKYLRSNKEKNIKDSITIGSSRENVSQENMHIDEYIPPFEPMKLKKKSRNRRDLKDDEDNADDDGVDETNDGEKVHEEEKAKVVEKEKQREREQKKFEKRLKHEINNQEREILKEALWNHGDPSETDKIFSEKSNEAWTAAADDEITPDTSSKPIDIVKYPFYHAEDIHYASPLRYATNPKTFPRKTGRGMEFYKSRDELVKCPDVRPDFGGIPRKNATFESGSEHKRIAGLGDKIQCLKKKYFDEDPLDNPIFKETEVNYAEKAKTTLFVQNRSLSGDATERGKKRAYMVVEKDTNEEEPSVRNTNKTREIEDVQYRSNYHYHPNRTLQIIVGDWIKGPQAVEKRLWNDRVIPVTEQVDEAPVPDFLTTRYVLWGLPSSLRRRDPHPSHLPLVTPTVPPPATSADPSARSRIIIPRDCMHTISKVAAQDGHKNLVIDCNDATLVQEIRNGVRHVKITPKIHENAEHQRNTGESDWVPIIGYLPLPGKNKTIRFSRKNDKISLPHEPRGKENDSKEKGVDKVKQHKVSYRKSKSSASGSKSDKPKRRKRAALYNYLERALSKHRKEIQNNRRTPLKSSLREFLTHLRKDKNKGTFEPRPFQKPEEVEPATIGSQYVQGNNGQEMVYIRIDSSEVGHWVIGQAKEDVAEGEAERFRKRQKEKL